MAERVPWSRIETDADGQRYMVFETERSRAALLWDRIVSVIGLGCGGGMFWVAAQVLLIRAPGSWGTLVFAGVASAIGLAFVVRCAIDLVRPPRRFEVLRELVTDQLLDAIDDTHPGMADGLRRDEVIPDRP